MRSTLVVGDCVDFVDDDCPHVAQIVAALLCGQQDVERFRRRYQNVRRMLQHSLALGGQRVAGADGCSDLWRQIAALQSQLLDFLQRCFEVFLDIVRERFERRDIDYFGLGAESAFEGFADEVVDADEKRSQRFARTGGR